MNRDVVFIDEAADIGDAGALYLDYQVDTSKIRNSLDAVSDKFKDHNIVLNNLTKESSKEIAKITKVLIVGISGGCGISVLSEALKKSIVSSNDYEYGLKDFSKGLINAREAGEKLRSKIEDIMLLKYAADVNYDEPLTLKNNHRGKHDPCGLRQDMNLKGRKHRCMV